LSGFVDWKPIISTGGFLRLLGKFFVGPNQIKQDALGFEVTKRSGKAAKLVRSLPPLLRLPIAHSITVAFLFHTISMPHFPACGSKAMGVSKSFTAL
jgi:hypothetical protein